MILETILVALLSQAPAPIPYLPATYHAVLAVMPSASAQTSRSTSSFSRSSTSISRSVSSSPSRSISSPPRVSIPSSKPLKAPSISSSSSSSLTRITKQKSSSSPSPSPSFTSRTTIAPTRPAPAPVVTRETYIERDSAGGLGSNPWFWMYMMDNDRPAQSAPPTQVIVQDTEGRAVKVPEHQLVVKEDSHNPIREFFVFLLGGGIATFVVRQFSR